MLRARALIRRRGAGDNDTAIGFLRRALAADPQFALAWTVLGNALTSSLTWDPQNREAIRREIDAAFDRSMALAPDLWTAHEARANQLELRHDWVAAEQANARSRALAPPSMREPLISRAHQLMIVGRVAECLPFQHEAARVEPLAPNSLQVALNNLGRYEEAEVEYRRAVQSAPQYFLNHMFALERRLKLRDLRGARQCLEACVATDPDPSSVLRALLPVALDDAEQGRAVVREMLEGARDRELFKILATAKFAAYFGDDELAIASLRRIGPQLLGVQITGIWDPLYERARKRPEFKELVRELNLTTYWRTTGQWGDFLRPTADGDFEVVR
jgi:tetratricopeptide (TPR) repeat protein